MTEQLPEFQHFTGYLPPGWHPASPGSFRRRCVEEMPSDLSPHARVKCPHREKMFHGYLKLHGALMLLGIATEQWIGGSYATWKVKPQDIDVVNFCDAHAYEALPHELRAMINQYFRGPDTAARCDCDSYLVSKGPPDHPCSADYLIKFNYWKKLFGHDRQGRPKGLIGVTIDPPPPPTPNATDGSTS